MSLSHSFITNFGPQTDELTSISWNKKQNILYQSGEEEKPSLPSGIQNSEEQYVPEYVEVMPAWAKDLIDENRPNYFNDLFCHDCGAILSLQQNQGAQYSLCSNCNLTTHHSSNTIYSSKIKYVIFDPNTRNNKEVEEEELRQHAEVFETCPKCGHDKMYFWTQQLRSADEGQTVFYECVKCAHRYNLNS